MSAVVSLIRYLDSRDTPRVGALAADADAVLEIEPAGDLVALATAAIAEGRSLARLAATRLSGDVLSCRRLAADGRILPPAAHPDPAHCLLSGTGLTHRASAGSRDAMHAAEAAGTETDSMRIYRSGESGGQPAAGEIGALPEWFYKGDGSMLATPGGDLLQPGFARDGGDEAELAAVYVIAPDGRPWRIGFSLANEFSDHVLEQGNYLHLAHSKLRTASLGPELMLGPLPAEVDGWARVLRGGRTVWESEFASGLKRMCHSLENLEHHHFKYPLFRRPGDVHVHFLGAATGSFTDGFQTCDGDLFELEAAPFRHVLRNRLVVASGETPLRVGVL